MEGDAHPILAGYIINISIHALRVEGDCRQVDDFRSTLRISIHALRVEGDIEEIANDPETPWISIHALRVEGDRLTKIPR